MESSSRDASISCNDDEKLRWVKKKQRSPGLPLKHVTTSREDALINETHTLRQQIYAEDSKFKKTMKTLKRKVYGLISICEEHGLNVPDMF